LDSLGTIVQEITHSSFSRPQNQLSIKIIRTGRHIQDVSKFGRKLDCNYFRFEFKFINTEIFGIFGGVTDAIKVSSPVVTWAAINVRLASAVVWIGSPVFPIIAINVARKRISEDFLFIFILYSMNDRVCMYSSY
jgi:hypothetical protein